MLTRTRHAIGSMLIAICKLGHQYVVGSGECASCRNSRSRCFQAHNKESELKRKRQYYRDNKVELDVKNRAYALANQDRIREVNRAWKKRNPERAAALFKAGCEKRRNALHGALGSHTRREWLAICKRQKNVCAACGDECKLTKDHIVPLSMGGSDFCWNIQGLCQPCNSRKGATIKSGTQLGVFDRVEARV